MEVHEVANIFPMMSEEEYRELVRDIKENGLREPIWTYQGKIIDGRNRYKACKELGITPKFQEWDGKGSLVSFVVSLNLHRRHLNSSQKAMVAAEIRPMLEKEAKERQREHGGTAPGKPKTLSEKIREVNPKENKSSYQAAKLVGTNERYVDYAVKIQKEAPELVEHVKAGRLNIPEAKAVAVLEPEERTEVIKRVTEAPPETKVKVKDIIKEVKPHVAYNSGNNEWYTPAEYIEAAREVMGGIDLDPASCAIANEVVKATKFYTAEDDGLKQEWFGRVWMNPPYAQPLITHFCEKLSECITNGSISEACVLVNNATETSWFQLLASHASAICFPRGRVKFWAPNKATAAPLQGQAVHYIGPNKEKFIERFSAFGVVVRL